MVDLSVIIPSLDLSPPFEWEQRIHPSIEYEVLVQDQNNASRARNAGINEARSEKLVFLDDDSSPRPNYFQRINDILDEYAAVTGRVVDTGYKYTTQFTNNYYQGDEFRATQKVIGCNMGFRKEVFDTVGGFDERLPLGHEERELADRVDEKFKIVYDPQLIVDHPFADSILGYWKKSYRHGHEEIVYWSIKNEDIEQKILSNVLNPYGYLHSSVTSTIVRSGATAAKNIGYLKGYVDSELL